jgi:hypothetical protein
MSTQEFKTQQGRITFTDQAIIYEQRRTTQHMPLLLVALALTLLGVTALSACGVPAQAAEKPNYVQTGVPDTSGMSGSIGATLHNPHGLDITLLAVKKDPTRWYFHFTALNKSSGALMVRGADKLRSGNAPVDQTSLDNQFVLPTLPAAKQPAMLPLTTPNAAEIASYPGFAASHSLVAQGKVDGWLAVDVTNIGAVVPKQVYYTFDPIVGEACKNPTDKSTCHPDTTYHVLVWDI